MKILEKEIMVTKSFLPPFKEYSKEIEKIWETHWLTNMGPLHEEFKKEVSQYLKTSNSTLCNNGHLALEIGLRALELPNGGEIITTPFTFASTTHAIVNSGLKPVFCDIEMKTYNLDVEKIEGLITEKTVAIMPVHVFGNPCDVKKIEEIAQKYNLKVFYDAAHAFGVEINEKGIGTFGDLSMFSLHATKVFNSIEGGVLTYNNPTLQKKLRLFKNFGITGPETVEAVGLNSKMNEFQAAMGIVNLRYIDEQIEKRKIITQRYRENLKRIEGITFIDDLENVKHNYSYFPIVIEEKIFGKTRDELFKELKEYNIFTRKYFYPLITDFDCYKEEYKNIELLNAKYISARVLTLPIYGELDLEIVEYICEVIKKIGA
ncbi:DegT/DnrJ/EryC1/StrS family aminotransferase [Cetobacterium somerae]|uniref:DegT/DnrJ/EryC1/StrS family aminotransferase n=1 Tax=Cetobacterium somerae TaxID=188913 RepID=UPI0022517D2F|nr:DegT/DnrJ/EryC1/StrS family aminotransferase [Cetobacterium somerae]MCX3067006.1 DegT/DnrJ/EryC1/StrS family aminotransferase [Cetobacterium somerae]